MAVTMEVSNETFKQRTFLGHPIGLYVLFFTEMWERFSYYGMRALLMLYMVNYFRWTQQDASAVYKWYTSLVYLTPILGGFLADRYLGNKRAVIIGAILMAVGHFLMAFEPLLAFYSALVFLILGNGFFKPNMSTQVGRLYPANDPRRDGAYTIFYMGINLGAFMSPLICGWLAENTAMKYHAGFAAAGVGMVVGLMIYLFGLRLVKELDPNAPIRSGMALVTRPQGATVAPASEQVSAGTPPLHHVGESFVSGDPPPDASESFSEKRVPEDFHNDRVVGVKPGSPAPSDPDVPLTEAECEVTPSALPVLNRVLSMVLIVCGAILIPAAPLLAMAKVFGWDNVIFLELGAICSFLAAWILSNVHNAVRDRVLAIYALAVFVVFFWAGFEQAGNVMNLWADQSTNRFLWRDASVPPLKPDEDVKRTGNGFVDFFNPLSTASFQSINALAIFLLAPLFAWMWTALDRRRIYISIPLKMGAGVGLLSLSFALMVGAAQSENGETTISNVQLPKSIPVNDKGELCQTNDDGKIEEPFFAGRLQYDAAKKAVILHGALPVVDRDRIVAQTAPLEFLEAIAELKKKAALANGQWVAVKLKHVPPGFDWSYTGFAETDPKDKEKETVKFDPSSQTLSTKRELAGKDLLALKVAAGDPAFREVLNKSVIDSSAFRVSLWWLFWAYILQTLGELCLSPVGLSMVSKLAPAKYATMLMGLWLLTSTFGHFVAGTFGEKYGTWSPTYYFAVLFVITGVASLILLLFVRKIATLMHGVK